MIKAIVIGSDGSEQAEQALRFGGALARVHQARVVVATAYPPLRSSSSTHAVGVGEAIELARVVGRLPSRIVVYGIEGSRFETGAALSAEVAAAVGRVVDAVLHEARELVSTTAA